MRNRLVQKMNDLDLCLEVVLWSCQPLCYIRRWISRKPLEIEAWFQRTTNRKWHMGYQIVTWPPKVLWGSTVGYPSDSLAFCSTHYRFVTDRHLVTALMHCTVQIRYDRRLRGLKSWVWSA